MAVSRERLKELWSECQTRDPARRLQFAHEVCAGDPELRDELASLIEADTEAAGWLESPALAHLPGRIGVFQPVRELGAGGMGVVYLAVRTDGEFEQRVAIKMLQRALATGAVLRRFQQERRILARLEHPSIARLIDGGEDASGQPYLVMEYVDGEPIDIWCRNRASRTPEKLRLMLQVCEAVHYAHQRLVVHRDLKPGNILVTADGQVKLLDFGVASLLEEPSGPVTGMFVTPEYASPEQIEGAAVTTAADIYSLGVVLYRLLSGKLPYRTQTTGRMELARAVCEQTPEPPTGADLDDIVLKALEKEPSRRYESAAALAADISRFLEGKPVLARRPTLGYRARKFILRHRYAAGAAALALLAVSGAMVVALQQRAAARELFKSSRALANTMIWDVEKTLRERGGTEARKVLLERATGYLEALQSSEYRDDSLIADALHGFRRMGEAFAATGSSGGNDPGRAMASYRQGLRLAAAHLAQNPGDLRARREQALITTSLGRLQLNRGMRDQAEQTLTEAHRLALSLRGKTIEGEKPWATEFDYAAALVALGDLAADKGEWEKLEQIRRDTVSLADKLKQTSGGDPAVMHLIGIAEKKLGAILSYRNKTEESALHYAAALAIDEEAYNRFPAGRERIDLSFSLSEMGGVLWKMNRMDKARPYFERALKLRHEAVNSDPADSWARWALGSLLLRMSSFEGVQKNYKRSGELLDEAEKLGGEPVFMARVYGQKAFLAERLGPPSKAVEEARRALKAFDEAAAKRALPAVDMNTRNDLEKLVASGGVLPRD
jgi:non-specific serine/threonine protein kinase/serine/threonine-protein kinase